MTLPRKMTLWYSLFGAMFTAYIISAQQVPSIIRTGFHNYLLLKYSWDPANDQVNNTLFSPTNTPWWLQARILDHFDDKQWWQTTGLIVWQEQCSGLWKGLRRGWTEKVVNDENQRHLYAGHGSSWKNGEDSHAWPWKAESVQVS